MWVDFLLSLMWAMLIGFQVPSMRVYSSIPLGRSLCLTNSNILMEFGIYVGVETFQIIFVHSFLGLSSYPFKLESFIVFCSILLVLGRVIQIRLLGWMLAFQILFYGGDRLTQGIYHSQTYVANALFKKLFTPIWLHYYLNLQEISCICSGANI